MWGKSPLDREMWRWNKTDIFTQRDLTNSIVVVGCTGSGKSSGPGEHIATGIVNHGCGILVLGSKPTDKAEWVARAKAAGREKDVILFGKGTGHTCNYLDSLTEMGADPRAYAEFLSISGEVLSPADKSGENQFWRLAEQRSLYNAASILKYGTGKVDALSLLEFFTGSAKKPADMEDEDWLAKSHARTLNAASAYAKGQKATEAEKSDITVAKAFWYYEWPQLDDKPRGNILAGIMNLLHTYNTGEVYRSISSKTTFNLSQLAEGKIIIADWSYHDHGMSGRFINSATKYLTQKFILSRRALPTDRPIVIWADEAQNVINSFDTAFLAECRSHKGCLVYLSQALHSFMVSEGQRDGKLLLSNFSTKIINAVGDKDTADWASALVPDYRETFVSPNGGGNVDVWDRLTGTNRASFSVREEWQPSIRPGFFYGLKRGGTANRKIVEAVIIKAGEPFKSSGTNWILAAFKQK